MTNDEMHVIVKNLSDIITENQAVNPFQLIQQIMDDVANPKDRVAVLKALFTQSEGFKVWMQNKSPKVIQLCRQLVILHEKNKTQADSRIQKQTAIELNASIQHYFKRHLPTVFAAMMKTYPVACLRFSLFTHSRIGLLATWQHDIQETSERFSILSKANLKDKKRVSEAIYLYQFNNILKYEVQGYSIRCAFLEDIRHIQNHPDLSDLVENNTVLILYEKSEDGIHYHLTYFVKQNKKLTNSDVISAKLTSAMLGDALYHVLIQRIMAHDKKRSADIGLFQNLYHNTALLKRDWNGAIQLYNLFFSLAIDNKDIQQVMLKIAFEDGYIAVSNPQVGVITGELTSNDLGDLYVSIYEKTSGKLQTLTLDEKQVIINAVQAKGYISQGSERSQKIAAFAKKLQRLIVDEDITYDSFAQQLSRGVDAFATHHVWTIYSNVRGLSKQASKEAIYCLSNAAERLKFCEKMLMNTPLGELMDKKKEKVIVPKGVQEHIIIAETGCVRHFLRESTYDSRCSLLNEILHLSLPSQKNTTLFFAHPVSLNDQCDDKGIELSNRIIG